MSDEQTPEEVEHEVAQFDRGLLHQDTAAQGGGGVTRVRPPIRIRYTGASIEEACPDFPDCPYSHLVPGDEGWATDRFDSGDIYVNFDSHSLQKYVREGEYEEIT